jgi:hypothetical protein
VSAFGDYEQGVKDDIARIEQTLLNAQKKYGGLTEEYYDQTKLIRQKLTDYKGFIDKVEADDTKEEEQIKTKNLMTEFYNIKQKEADTTGGITETIVPRKKPEPSVVDVDKTKAAIEAAKNRERVASSSRGIQSAGNQAPSGGGGRDRGAAAAGMGGGSRQATSAGSTKSTRSDGGWGWKDGGLVRKPYSDGGIVDLL